MKRLLTLVAFFATLQASAQQVNPVPDYVFANRMSAGRNTVTDTAAYFSIGPRYGATRGMMPPMVVDTASFSANKRNGLLIFSVQKNKFLYWDSVGVKWAEMAGTAGTALTSADTAALLSTRAWRQKGIDSLAAIRIAGSGTTNYVPKFTAGSTIGNSQIFDNGTSVGIGITTGMGERFNVANSSGNANASISTSSATSGAFLRFGNSVNADGLYLGYNNPAGTLFGGTGGANGGVIMGYGLYPMGFGTNATERMRIFANGRIFIGPSPSDLGDYRLQVSGNLYNSGTAVFAATSGRVGIGTTAPVVKLDIRGTSTQDIFLVSTSTTNQSNSLQSYFNNGAGYSNLSIISRNLSVFNGLNDTSRVESVRIDSSGNVGINTTSPTQKLEVNGNIKTAAPSGGTAQPFKIGEASTVSPTSPNRTIRVEINGVVYYIHAKTTND